MALLAFWGFDDAMADPGVTTSGPITFGSTANSRTGAGGAMITNASGSTYCALSFPTGTTLVHGFGLRLNYYGTSWSWWRAFEGLSTPHLSLRFDASKHMLLYRGDGATLLATSTWTAPAGNVWMYVEIKVSIATTGGMCEVRVNGQTIISYSGNTRNGGSGFFDTTIFMPSENSSANYITIDDAYMLDTTGVAPYNDYLNDIVVRTLLPNGNGDSSQWVGSDADSVNNYQLVDDPSSSMTDYVGSSISGDTDLYTMEDLPATYNVLATQEVLYAQKSDGGVPPNLQPATKGVLGTVRTDTAISTLSTTAQVFNGDIRTVDPDNNPLTVSTVNGMQIGVKLQ